MCHYSVRCFWSRVFTSSLLHPLSLPSLLLILFSCLSSRDVHRVENTHTSAVHRTVAIRCSPNPSAHSQRPASSCPHYNHRLCCFHTNIPVVHTRAFSPRTYHSEDVILKMFPNSYIDLFPRHLSDSLSLSRAQPTVRGCLLVLYTGWAKKQGHRTHDIISVKS